MIGDWWQDVRFALRTLRRQPGFAVVAVLTLALGIGASTAVFTLVNGVLLRPLALPEPDQLYALYSANHAAGRLDAGVSPPDVEDWRAQQTVFTDLGAYWFTDGQSGLDFTGAGEPKRLSTVFVTPGFFGALGVTPLVGRLPREEELVRGGPDRVVVLTHGFWQRQFGASSAVVGTTVTLNGEPYQVLGVLPPGMRYPAENGDVFVPYSTIPESGIPWHRSVRILRAIARARPGVTLERAQTEMRTIARRLAQEYATNAQWDDATVRPLHDAITGSVRTPLLVLLGAVGFVLLMVCVNIAGLQLVRATGRHQEVAVRASLGASRGRLVRQLLTESLVLAGVGCLGGLVVAQGAVALLLRISTGQLPRAWEVSLDLPVLGFAVVVSLVAGCVFGVVPAFQASLANLRGTLQRAGRGTVGGATARIRNVLVVSEVALAMMLVVGAGLMTRSFITLLRVDPGFVPDDLVAVQFSLSTARHGDRYIAVYRDVLERVRALPGVIEAGAAKDAPLRGGGEFVGFRLPGMTIRPGEDPPLARALHVSDGYFRTIRARMLDGREFTTRDDAASPPVVVVNDAFARRWFPGERAVGKTIVFGPFNADVVGVVNDIRQMAVAEPADPTIYIDNYQNSRLKMTLVARVTGEPMAAARTIQEAIWSVDRDQTITSVFTFGESLTRALGRPRLLTMLLVGFGAFGLLIGSLGVFGVLSYLVNQREREIGLRLALGAAPSAVRAAFVRHGLGLAGLGIAVGLAGALVLSRFVGAVLYDVSATDPATIAMMAGVLLLVATVASWLPARRASGIDPMEALRNE